MTSYRLEYPKGIGEAKWRLAYPRAFPALVAKNTKANQLPEALQLAIMREESAFSPRIESFANAIGLTQMLVKTAKRFANGATVTREVLLDPAKNVEIGSRFLGFLWKHFDAARAAGHRRLQRGRGGGRPLAGRARRPGDGRVHGDDPLRRDAQLHQAGARVVLHLFVALRQGPVPAVPLAARGKAGEPDRKGPNLATPAERPRLQTLRTTCLKAPAVPSAPLLQLLQILASSRGRRCSVTPGADSRRYRTRGPRVNISARRLRLDLVLPSRRINRPSGP